MGKRFSLMATIRSFRWWFVTYGSLKPFNHPLMFWFRTPPFSIWMLIFGIVIGASIVWNIPVVCK